MLIDGNAWIGHWPFAAEPARHWPEVAWELHQAGVSRAIVSPLEAVLAPYAGQANAGLLRESEKEGAVEWLAAPVIDATLTDAVYLVEQYAGHDRVVAVRLLPAYHGYRLFDVRAQAVIEAATAHQLIVMIQMRMEDPRMQHALLHLPTLAVDDIVSVAAAHSDASILVAAAHAAEARTVTRELPNVYVDVSWLDGPEPVRELLPACGDQLVFGTHAPLLEPAAAAGKLRDEELDIASREKIEHETIARLIRSVGTIADAKR